MSASPNPLPATLTGKRPARTVMPHVNQLRTNKAIEAAPLASSLQALQQQNDDQSKFNGNIVSYLATINTGSAAPTTNTVTINGTPFSY